MGKGKLCSSSSSFFFFFFLSPLLSLTKVAGCVGGVLQTNTAPAPDFFVCVCVCLCFTPPSPFFDKIADSVDGVLQINTIQTPEFVVALRQFHFSLSSLAY